MKKTNLVLAIILVSVVLFACLGFLGYFGFKTLRRARLRMDARAAFAAEDWKKSERLLNEYIMLDPDSEEEIVRLAYVYRHFGNTEEEMHCWYKASKLNPLKPEYWDLYTECAMNARSFAHLYTTLSRMISLNEELSPKDKILYLICAVMTGRAKYAELFYEEMLQEEPETFLQNDLAKYAEFLMSYKKSDPDERSKFIEYGIESDDPVVRLESTLLYLVELEFSEDDESFVREQEELMLKQAIVRNRFAVTPLLANVYFYQLKFRDVIELAEPYLEDINNILLSVLYAESCVYSAQTEKLKPLAEKYRTLGWKEHLLASYFEALYDFTRDEVDDNILIRHMQEMSGSVQTDLANLINLQIALNSDNLENICVALETIMRKAPFFDLQERARVAVRHYLGRKLGEVPEDVEDSRLAKLAQLITGPEKTDPFLMRIIISDLYRRNALTRQILQENLKAFPSDTYLLQVAAEFELFVNNNPKQCLEYIEQFYALKTEERSNAFDFMHMLTMEIMGKIDEAAKEYTALVEKSEMDRGILYRYYRFCIEHERRTELSKMADRLDDSTVPDLKALGPFFRAEDLLLQGKTDEALALLETAETIHPDFALRAANLLSTYDHLDQALSHFLALADTHFDKRLIQANIAEVYYAKGMKKEALTCAEQAWEVSPDDAIGQFVYSKMLAANGRYQDAEKILRVPYRKIKLPDEVKDLWTDIMLHCVQEDIANRNFTSALDRSNHYLILFPNEYTFQEFKSLAEQELRNAPDPLPPRKELR